MTLRWARDWVFESRVEEESSSRLRKSKIRIFLFSSRNVKKILYYFI